MFGKDFPQNQKGKPEKKNLGEKKSWRGQDRPVWKGVRTPKGNEGKKDERTSGRIVGR